MKGCVPRVAFVLWALSLAGCASSSQSVQEESPETRQFKTQLDALRPDSLAAPDTVYLSADPMPEVLNYREAIFHLAEYPKEARTVQGRVIVQFVVSKEGWTVEPDVVKSLHPVLDAEALEVVRYLRFRPGRRDGTPVAVRMAFPVSFNRPDLDVQAPRDTQRGQEGN